jgi:hypothetical protein
LVGYIRGQDYNNNPMAIGPIDKLYINVARMAINKKEMSRIIAFRFYRVLEGYL